MRLTSEIPTECAQEQACAISLVWGCPVSIWVRKSDGWLALTGNENEVAELRDPLESATRNHGFCIHTSPERTLLALKLNLPGTAPLVALGELPSDAKRLTEIIARMTQTSLGVEQELNRQQSQLTAYATQVTHDLEELTWLRSLSEKIELNDDRNSVKDACAEILPTLCEMVMAEQVMLVQKPIIPGAPLSTTFSSGTDVCTIDRAQRMIDEFQDATRFQPVVRNRVARSEFGPVHSLILVSVESSTYQFGWLLIVNKKRQARFLGTNYDPLADLDHYNALEFGTMQASLASAAAAAIATYASNSKLLSDRDRLLTGAIRAMVNAIDAKDSYTCGHSDRVALMAKHLSRELKLPPIECQQIYMTGLLHDIGKIGVPDSVLLKPGRLTEEEFSIIKTHPRVGYDILQHVQMLQYTLPGVLHHHEAVDGTGYPDGLKGDNIPLHARILAVADAYDAMTSNRPYRDGMPRERAENILRENAGKQWDAKIVDCFMATLPEIHRICFDAERSEKQRSEFIEQFAHNAE